MDLILKAYEGFLGIIMKVDHAWSRRPYKLIAEMFLWVALAITALCFFAFLYPLIVGELIKVSSTVFMTWLIVEFTFFFGTFVLYPYLLCKIRADRHSHNLALARQNWHPTRGH